MITKNYLNHYFDHIYILNLESEVATRLIVAQHLKKYGISFEIFEATNGYEGEPLDRYKKYQERALGNFKRYPKYSEIEKQRNKPYIESAGAIGIIYSFLRIFEDSKKKGYKRFLIFEDDILLSKNFESEFKNFIQNIDEDWKILQLGASQFHWSKTDLSTASQKGFYFPRNLDTYGAFATAYNHTIVDELIEAVTAFEAPFDHLPMGELYERYLGKCYVAYPNIVIADVSNSSVRESQNQHTEALRRKWPLTNFDFPLNKLTITVIITSKKNLKYYSNFSNTKQRPFNLRLFLNSNNGLGTLHNAVLLNNVKNEIQPLNKDISIFHSDYLAIIDKEIILLEEDIIKFLEYKIGLLKKNLTSLKTIKYIPRNIKNDREKVLEQKILIKDFQSQEIKKAMLKMINIKALFNPIKKYKAYKDLIRKIQK